MESHDANGNATQRALLLPEEGEPFCAGSSPQSIVETDEGEVNFPSGNQRRGQLEGVRRP